MNKIFKTFAFTVIFLSISVQTYANTEENDKKRITDIFKIADWIEEYKTISGHYPFETEQEKSGYQFEIQIGLNHIVNSIAYNGFKPESPRIKEIGQNALEEELERVLKRNITLPHDPLVHALNHLSFYVYHISNKNYWLAAHLKGNFKHSARLGENYYKFEVTSYQGQDSNGVHYKSLTQAEKEAILTPLKKEKWTDTNEAHKQFNAGRYKKAIKYFNKAIKKDKNNYFLYHMRGVCNVRLNRYKKAESDYNKAIELAPSKENLAVTFTNKAYLYAYQEKYQEGVAFIYKALELNPNHIDAAKALSDYGMDMKNHEIALEGASKYLKLNPSDVNYLLREGALHLKFNDIKKATDSFNRALKEDPKHYKVAASSGLYCFESGFSNEAIHYFKIGLERNEISKKDLKQLLESPEYKAKPETIVVINSLDL